MSYDISDPNKLEPIWFKPPLESVPCTFCDEFVVFERPSGDYISPAMGVCAVCSLLTDEEKQRKTKKSIAGPDHKLVRLRNTSNYDSIYLNMKSIKKDGWVAFYWEITFE